MYDTISNLKILAKISLSIHCGCALYRQFVTYPAILENKNPTECVKNFESIFHTTQKIQIPTKLISLGCCLLNYYLKNNEKNILYAGIVIALITPYSHGYMSPLSDKILDKSLDDNLKIPFLNKWTQLHSGRLGLALLANILMNI